MASCVMPGAYDQVSVAPIGHGWVVGSRLAWHALTETVNGRIDHSFIRVEHPSAAVERFGVKEPCEHPR